MRTSLSMPAPTAWQPPANGSNGTGGTTSAATTTTTTTTTSKVTVYPLPPTEEKSMSYWAKGTGFGTGSTAPAWDVSQALARQRHLEEHVAGLLRVIAAFINPGEMKKSLRNGNGEGTETDGSHLLPSCLPVLLQQSCLQATICAYLRNDSGEWDMDELNIFAD